MSKEKAPREREKGAVNDRPAIAIAAGLLSYALSHSVNRLFDSSEAKLT